MYTIIAGKHPIYQSGDDLEKYLNRIKTQQINFPSHFSNLAKEFFFKLTKTDPLERYTAKEALAHPWITRKPGKIPLSFIESHTFDNSKIKLANVFLRY